MTEQQQWNIPITDCFGFGIQGKHSPPKVQMIIIQEIQKYQML